MQKLQTLNHGNMFNLYLDSDTHEYVSMCFSLAKSNQPKL